MAEQGGRRLQRIAFADAKSGFAGIVGKS